MMNSNLDFKSFLKFMGRNKFYTAINIFGFSVSLMFVILIAVYAERELNIDKRQANGDRIAVLANEESMGTAVPVAYWLEERYPEIEKVCPAVFDRDEQQITFNDKKYVAKTAYVDSTFFEIFSFELLDGGREQALQDSYGAVISESFAHKLFGNENPMGRTLNISDSTGVTITGVMRDIDRSVIPYVDVLLRIERVAEFNPSLSRDNAGNAGSCVAFILQKPGADLSVRADEMLEFFKERFWVYKMDFLHDVRILPFSEIYFSDLYKTGMEGGDRRFVLVLLSVGILVLLFAIINYINLTSAQAGQRAKEMAMRRLLGSSRESLLFRLIAETTLMTLVSFVIGMLLAQLALPYACNLLQVRFTLATLVSPAWFVAILLLILIVGGLSGLLPALLISSVKPIDVVRGTFRRRTKMVFSKVFIVFQNVITIVMIAASLTMYLQINHLIKAPLGYNTTNIIEADNVFRSHNEMAMAEDLLRQLPCVKEIGRTNGTPSSGTNNLSATYEGKSLSFQQMVVDSAAFRIFGLQIKQDNHVAASSGGWYLNELAFKQMELPEDTVTFKVYDTALPILGVLKDFRLWDISRDNSPLMLRFRNDSEWWPWNYIIEVQGNPAEAYDAVRKVFEEVSGLPFEGQFIDDGIQKHFETQVRMSVIVAIFAAIAVLISLLGMVAMATYFNRQREQEMAVRKIFGSDNFGILNRLVGTFLSYVGIAFVIAVPLIWYFMNGWLSDYSYRISLSPLIFIAAGLFCLLIALLAVFFQSWRAANVNPVEHLKTE